MFQKSPSGYHTAYEKSSSTSKSFESNHWENRLKKEVSIGGGILTEKESKKGKRRVWQRWGFVFASKQHQKGFETFWASLLLYAHLCRLSLWTVPLNLFLVCHWQITFPLCPPSLTHLFLMIAGARSDVFMYYSFYFCIGLKCSIITSKEKK